MKNLLILLALLPLAACATPVVTMKDNMGDLQYCGGGIAGSAYLGLPGYAIERHYDMECVKHFKSTGYKVVDVK